VVLGRSVVPGAVTLRCNFYTEVTGTDLSTKPLRQSAQSLCAALLECLKIK